jgi:hypothetical protein
MIDGVKKLPNQVVVSRLKVDLRGCLFYINRRPRCPGRYKQSRFDYSIFKIRIEYFTSQRSIRILISISNV